MLGTSLWVIEHQDDECLYYTFLYFLNVPTRSLLLFFSTTKQHIVCKFNFLSFYTMLVNALTQRARAETERSEKKVRGEESAHFQRRLLRIH